MSIKNLHTLVALTFTCICGISANADAGRQAYARLEGDSVLVVGNALIERRFEWNGGNLKTLSLENKETGIIHRAVKPVPDFVFTKDADKPGHDGRMSMEPVKATATTPEHLRIRVEYAINGLDIRRDYLLWENVPAIACHTSLRCSTDGETSGIIDSKDGNENAADRRNIEFTADMVTSSKDAILDRINLKGAHFHAKAVEFSDITDWYDNLVWERDIISYRKTGYRGNLLFVRDGADGNGFFFLKEAPTSAVQLSYGRGDFTADFGQFAVTGNGLSAKDLGKEWTRAYSVVTGVFGDTEFSALKALRTYQKQIRSPRDGRDEMVMMNTWGDRSQDTKVNEKFCLEELQMASRLGISHFQIDDGWQEGKSPNSALAKGSFRNIWDNPDYWKPAKDKYPDGLNPIMRKAEELGIEIGLWFNPSVQNDFKDWEKDAEAVLALYREYGIKIFKIDGLTINNKEGEVNLRKFFDTVVEASNGDIMFNLDATASRRGGYHMFNEYGNIFLENRYTDWQNYYPYRTLRNLWQLSRYVPAERIQIEFLNKWRNAESYGDDIFAPSAYDFPYLFATSMAAQPLAWMEAHNLPEEAYGIAPLIREYRKIAADFHKGIILPIGDEPSGRSWTGFQSVTSDTEGYLLVYRELNPSETGRLKTFFPEGAKVSLKRILGEGKESFACKTGHEGIISLSLPDTNSFALYRYTIKK